jgi:hypothetical protein
VVFVAIFFGSKNHLRLTVHARAIPPTGARLASVLETAFVQQPWPRLKV